MYLLIAFVPALRAFGLTALMSIGLCASARAELLQIIHTNDLHSHLEHAGDLDLGGYAAVKATIDRIKTKAEAQGIQTLVLDGGDFSEGSALHFAKRGVSVWRVMNAMGYDAVTLGNHDWVSGSAGLDWILSQLSPGFALLSANFIYSSKWPNLARNLKPEVELKKGGLRIGILGLSTDEIFHNWMVGDGHIEAPWDTAKKRLPGLRARNDLVILLTHLGIWVDPVVLLKSRGVDLVVGGHSHTLMKEVNYAPDASKRFVPMVQAGSHGEHVGDLLVDVVPGQPMKIVSYALVPVRQIDGMDPVVQSGVVQARKDLEADYGAPWLYDEIANSSVPLSKARKGNPNIWANFVTESFRQASGADLAIDLSSFQGVNQAAGPVTREKIMTFFPRTFDTSKPLGWTVWTLKARGIVLAGMLPSLLKLGPPMTFAGLTYSVKNGRIRDVRIGGQKIKWLKTYRIAVTEALGRSPKAAVPELAPLMRGAVDTGVPLWTAIEQHLIRQGGVQ